MITNCLASFKEARWAYTAFLDGCYLLTHQFLVSLLQELTQFKAFGAVEGLQVVVSVRHWQANVPRHSGMLFRGFVYKVWILLLC